MAGARLMVRFDAAVRRWPGFAPASHGGPPLSSEGRGKEAERWVGY